MVYERKRLFSLGDDVNSRAGPAPVKRKRTLEELQEIWRRNGYASKGRPRRVSPIVVVARCAIARRAKAVLDKERIEASRWYQWPGIRDQAMQEAYRAGVIPEWVWLLRETSGTPRR